MKPFVTVYSGVAQIDPLIADPVVLAAMPGMTAERTKSVLSLRGRRGADATALSDVLGTAQAFAAKAPARTTRLRIAVRLRSGYAGVSEVVIVHYSDDLEPYRVLMWEDDIDLRGAAGDRP